MFGSLFLDHYIPTSLSKDLSSYYGSGCQIITHLAPLGSNIYPQLLHAEATFTAGAAQRKQGVWTMEEIGSG